ncbi:MAG: hypothetical protein NT015_01310 [Alphaproteobacteria bacterium]|nr:hypothetical protein [Alphaproteobacteria bacterium]
MQSKKVKRAALLLTLCASAMAPAAAHAEGWSFSSGVDYTSGDYGTGQDTDILIAPFSVTFEGERWRASATATYVSVEGAPGVVPGATSAIGAGSPLSGVTNPLGGGLLGSNPSLAPEISEQGLGDTTLEVAFIPHVGDSGARISVSGAARLPTGDEERSLGAGETILSGAVGASHPIGDRVGIYGAVGYSQALDSDEGGVFVSGGLEGRVTDTMLIGASAEWSEASVAGAPERTQATLYSSFALSDHVRIAAYAVAGPSDAAPDAGGGLRLTLR